MIYLFWIWIGIRQAIGPYEDLLTIVKKRKLRCHGHKTRSTELAKMILQGTVQGGRRRGRQKKRWEDNVTEWTGLKLGEALRKAESVISIRWTTRKQGNNDGVVQRMRALDRCSDRLVGLVVKASASRAEDPGLESRLSRDFFGVESYQ